ncbi:hypothetical protein KRP22_009425 [Phytophthora ramorum]|nr:putative pectate lyase D [Phytophthora ramorum]
MLGDGPSAPLCQYSESDVHINGDVSQATGTSGSSTSTETASSSTGSSATSQVSTNSTADASDASAPGTVAPANTESGESSQSEQQQSSEKSTDESEQQQQSNASENTDDDSDKKSSDDTDSDKNQEEEEENNDDAQNEEQTIVSSAAGSNTSSDSSNTGSTVQSSSTGSTTQSSNAGSATQSSDSDSPTQTATNTSTNTNTSTSTSTGSVPDGTWPASTGTVLYKEPYTIKAGEVFDGKMQTFERSDVTCSEGEGQKDTAVFLVEAGGTLKNAIIGKNQKEGVHCDDHDCTIENVWWDDVCEDALSIKGGSASSVTTVTNCGARYASDKVVQHNGYGTVKIDGFYAQEFGKLYRSCGTCGDIPRIVTVENVYAVDPLVSVVTVNKNYGDQATLKSIRVKTTDGSTDVKVCQWSQGGSTPSNVGDGPSGTLCQYSESDVQINQ